MYIYIIYIRVYTYINAHLKQMGLDQDPHCSHSSEMLGDSDASKDNRSPKCVMILMQ